MIIILGVTFPHVKYSDYGNRFSNISMPQFMVFR